MPINEYDEMLESGKAPAGNNEYADMLAGEDDARSTAVQGSMFVASQRDPSRHARVLELAGRAKLPVEIVDRNFDEIEKSTPKHDYQQIIGRAPGLAKYLENPDNATLARDELDVLEKVDRAATFAKPKDDSLAGDWTRAFKGGFENLTASTYHLAAAYGFMSPAEAAEQVARANRRAQEIRALMPDYAREFSLVMDEEGGEFSKAANRFVGSFDELRRGHIMQALKDFGGGGIQSVGEALDVIAAAAVRPQGLSYAVVENLAQSLPALAAGGVGAATGAEVGAYLGSLTFIPQIAAGAAAVGGTVGFVGGSFLGGAGTEIGAWFNNGLQKRGFDLTSPEDILRAYSDPQLMAELRGEAERKGVTTAGVDMLFNAFAGRLLKGAQPGSVASQAARGATELAVQSAGESASEFAGQAAAARGDLSKVDFSEVLLEGITSLGQSAAEIGIGSAVGFSRTAYDPDPAVAGEQLAQDTSKALQAAHEAQAMQELGAAVKELQTTQKIPGKIKELVDLVTEGNENAAVYFQVADWDRYWSDKGLSPATAAGQIMNDEGKAYYQAKAAGQNLSFPLGQYVEGVALTEHFDGLLTHEMSRPDGMTLAQAREFFQGLPKVVREIADEAQNALPETFEMSAKEVGKIVASQLKQTGFSANDARVQAKLYESRARVRAQLRGQDPLEMFKAQNLQIRRNVPEVVKKAREQVDELDPIIDRLRAGDIPKDSKVFGKSLTEFLREKGGLKDEGTELSYLDVDSQRKPFQRNLIKEAGVALDRAAQIAAESGYIQSEDPNELLAAIGDELRGNPVYSLENRDEELFSEYENLRTYLDAFEKIGIDLEQMDNAEVKRLLMSHEENQGFSPADLGYEQSQLEGVQTEVPLPNEVQFVEAKLPKSIAAAFAGNGSKAEKREAQEKVRKIGDKKFRGKSFVNENTGWPILVSREGLKKAKGFFGRPENIASFLKLDDVIAKSVYLYREDDRMGRADIKAIHKFYAPMRFDGKEYVVKLTVRETKEGKRFYDQIALEKEIPADSPRGGASEEELRGRVSGTAINIGDFIRDVNDLRQSDPFFQGAVAPTFYSKVQRTIEEKMGNSATADQVRGLIKEIKEEERKWSGIDDFLKGKAKVAKQELLDFLAANQLEVQEITKGEKPTLEGVGPVAPGDTVYNLVSSDGENRGIFVDRENARTMSGEGDAINEVAWDGVSELEDGRFYDDSEEQPPTFDQETQFEKYTLPGGENYREVLFSLPRVSEPTNAPPEAFNNWMDQKYGPTWYDDLSDEEYRRALNAFENSDFMSPHFLEPNILAHVRLNDRTDTDGKKVLFVEEIQSDWHQEGRKKGYKSEDPLNISSVPDAPFRKTWHEFALKRIIRMAAEGGYDKIAWTTGEQQAERYDLSKQIDAVGAFKNKDGTFDIEVYKNGSIVKEQEGVKIESLDEFLGKDLAEKIRNEEGKKEKSGYRIYKGLDLKVGGEGMKGFYDKMIPTFLNKFGKKYAAKVENTTFNIGAGKPTEYEDFADYMAKKDGVAVKAHALEITPQLRDAALNEGFPLFQDGGDGARGRIRFGRGVVNIDLLRGADQSTFLHETGHLFLNDMAEDYAYVKGLDTLNDRQKAFLKDAENLLKWMGAKSFAEIKTKHHEKFARGFESYLMEGKAPSKNLKSAFSRFKLWLIEIYKSIKSLNVELTADVRGIMDRMLATQEEIRDAQRLQNMEPLFFDPSAIGMNEKDAQAYLDAQEQARLFAEEQLSEKLIHDFSRQRATWWTEEKARVREEIDKEVSQQRVYRALSILQKGKDPTGVELPEDLQKLKIDRDGLLISFGKDFIQRLPRPAVYAREGGIHHDVVASLLGFKNGSELIFSMINAPRKEDLVEQLTQKRMEEKYPDLLNDSRIVEEAMKAVHNEKRAEVIGLEMKALSEANVEVLKENVRRVNGRLPSQLKVTEQAERAILELSVSELNPRKFQLAEQRAAREASQALIANDWNAAFEAKRRELINHELFRVATLAKDNVDNTIKDFKKLNKSDKSLSKTRDMNLVNAARAVLAGFGVGKVDQSPSDYIEPIKHYDPETFDSVSHLVNQALMRAGDYRKATYETFLKMKEDVTALWDLSLSTRQIEINGQKMDIKGVQQQLEVRINLVAGPKEIEKYERTKTKWEKTKMGLLGIRAAMTRVASWVSFMDGGDLNGVFRTYILNPVLEATDSYRVAKRQYIEKYLEIVKGVEKRLSRNPIDAPELGFQFKNKAQLIGALLHTGNESNLSKLLRGYNWGFYNEVGQLDTENWGAFINRMHREGVIGKEEWDYVQAVWDLLEEIKPLAQKSHKEIYGYYFNEVTKKEVVTPFGVYAGGYVPATVDTFQSEDAAIRQEKESIEKSNNSFMFPTTGRGFTKERVQQYAAPLMIDMEFIPAHIDKVLKFSYIEPHVKSVSRIVMNKGFRKVLEQVDPAIGGDMLVPWLQRAAQQMIETPSKGWGGRGADRFFRELRRRTGLQVMFVNVVNTLQNFTGMSVAAVKVKPKYLRDGLWRYVRGSKELEASVSEKSKFMQTRVSARIFEVQQSIDELLLDPSKYEKAREFAQKHGYFLQSATQNIVDLVVWSGAYEQAIAKKADERQAVRAADAAVRETQGSFNPEDVSRFETGTAFVRAFTMFYSYFNMQANLLGSEFATTMRDMGLKKGAGRLLYVYTFGFMAPALISELVVRAAGGAIDEDDDDKYLDDVMSMFFGSQLRTAAAFVPGLGPAVLSGINAFNDKWYDDRISTSPAVSMIESAARAPYSVYKAVADDGSGKRAARDTLTLLGMVTGLPLAPLSRPIGYLSDVSEGRANPDGPLDFTRGIVTGRSGE